MSLKPTSQKTSAFDPGNALVFWLVGFSDNPAAPFEGHADRMNGTKMISPFYEFDTDRLGTDSTGTIRYFPKHSVDDYDNAEAQRAFLYFDKKAYGTACDSDGDATDDFYAYRKVSNSSGTCTAGGYYNPQGTQIINAGLDGQLGAGGYPGYAFSSTAPASGDSCDCSYTDGNADNLTNFSGGTMGDYTEE